MILTEQELAGLSAEETGGLNSPQTLRGFQYSEEPRLRKKCLLNFPRHRVFKNNNDFRFASSGLLHSFPDPGQSREKSTHVST